MHRKRSGRRNAKPKKSWLQKCKDCLRQLLAFLFSNVGIICLVVGYTLLGAVMFIQIEGSPESVNDENNFQYKLNCSINETLENLWDIASVAWTANEGPIFRNKTEEQLKRLQEVIVFGVKINDWDGKNIYSERWTIYAAFLYCLTVITTIGYGNVFPHTNLGKMATIVYAIFGMPLFLLYLSNIGDLLAKSFKWLYAKFCLCKICRLRKRRSFGDSVAAPAIPSANPWRSGSEKTWSQKSGANKRACDATDGEDSDDEDTETSTSSSSISTNDVQDITVPISLCLMIMIGFISLGALLFGNQEGLEFLDGSYFCFISLSTIGFGDIVPSTKTGREFELNFIFCSIYLMLGMALIAMCFNLMQQDVVQKIRTCTDIIRRIARCRR